MAQELASGYVSLTVKTSDSMSKITKDITGLDATAKKSGEKAGKSLSLGLVKGSNKAGSDASRALQERLGERVGETIGLKVGRAIARPISKIMGTAGTDAGQKFSSNFESAATKSSKKAGAASGGGFMATFAGFLKGPALGVIGVASAGIGIAITKGIGRLTAIDDAKAKLLGLGHDAQSVQKIMDSATAAVKGTAFGLDEAATAAATAVAAGIKPGEELTAYLTKIADAAAIANVPLAEMAPIFNRVQTNGKAMTDDLQQLADRGIPVFTWLQEELGVTGEELSDMVSEGKVSAATFQKIIGDNIGGAAQKMGSSTSGALKNLNAAVGRFGAALAGPIFGKAAGVFTSLTGVVDKATKAMGPLLEKLGAAFTTFLDGKIMPFIESAMPKVKEFFSGFGQFLPQAVSALSSVGGAASDALPKILPILQAVGGTLLDVLKSLASALAPLASRLVEVVKTVYQGIGSLAQKIAPTLAPLGQAIVKVFKALMPALKLVGQVVGNVLGVVAKVVFAVAGAVLPVVIKIVTWLVDKIGGLISWLTGTAFPAIGNFFKFIGDAAMGFWNGVLKPVGSGIAAVFKSIGAVAMWLWNSVFTPVFNGLKFAVELWWAYAQIVFKAIGIAIRAVGDVMMWLWRSVGEPVWNGIKSAIGAAWTVIEPIWNLFKSGIEVVGNAMQSLWHNHVTPVWEGIKGAFGAAWDFISGIFEKIKSGFGAVGDAIKGIASGIGDGVKAAFSGVVDIIKAPLHALGSFLASIPTNVLGVDIPGADKVQGWGKSLQGLATGGLVRGPGSGTSDSILAWLSNGEGVVTAKAMANGGADLVAALNAGWTPSADLLHKMIPGFAEGLSPGADYLRSQIMNLWPQIGTIGGKRSEDGYGEHSSGNAMDVMIPGYDTPQGKALGDAVASFVSKNAEALGLDGFIWRQTSYGYGGSFTTGKAMSDRGSDTQNHMDHVHIMLGKGRGAGAPQVNLPTSSLSLPSGGSVFPGGGSSRSGGGKSATPAQLQNAQDRITDLENKVQTSELALQEAEANPKTKESTLKTKRDAVDKNKRELEQAKQTLSDLQSQGGESGSDSNNPYTKIMEAVKEIIGDSPGQLAQIGLGGVKESLLPPGFSDPQGWPLVQSGSALMKWAGGLIGGIPGMEAVGAILGGTGSAVGGDASGATSSFTSLLPAPFGDLKVGSPDMLPADFNATQHTGSGAIPGPGNLASAFVPDPAQAGGGQVVNNDNSVHVAEGGSIGSDPVKVTEAANRQQRAAVTPHLSTRRYI